jgi:Leucine-rich repeat (LRR) protein
MLIGMKMLENLDLSFNLINHIEIDAFYYIETLNHLNLSHNHIGKLTKHFFQATRSVEYLNLNDNKISMIIGSLDDIEMNINELHMHNNRLVSFDPVLVKSAEYLDLTNNQLCDEINFSDTQLRDLRIGGNRLKKLSINENLKVLNVSKNRERSFSISFDQNYALTYLYLSNLDIVLYDDILNDIKKRHNLKELDLSRNNLVSIDLEVHQFPRSLEVLDLKKTDLHSLKNWENLSSLLPNLKALNIQDNFFDCNEFSKIIAALQNARIKIVGLNDESNRVEFLKQNCATKSYHNRNSERKIVEDDDSSTVVWLILIVCLGGYLVVGIFILNKKFNLSERILGNSQPHIHRGMVNEIYPTLSNANV